VQGAPAEAVVGRAVVGSVARHCSLAWRRWRVDWGDAGECGQPNAW
jgi:hypothetical protein